MKKNNLVLIMLLLIYSIMSIEEKDYDLVNGQKTKISSFLKNEVYKFYTKANFAQNVTLTFYTKMIESPFSHILVYEYSNRHDEIANVKKNLSIINLDDKHGDSVAFVSYIVKSSSTNYIAFGVIPKQQISSSSIVKIDVIDGPFDLSKQGSKKINTPNAIHSFEVTNGIEGEIIESRNK